jgi:hypothetical protein
MTMQTRNAVRAAAVLAGLAPAALLGACANDQAASPNTGSAAATTPLIPPSNSDAMRRQGTGTVPGSFGGATAPGPATAPGAATPGRVGTGGVTNTVPGS